MTTEGEASTPDLSEFEAYVKQQGPSCTFSRKTSGLGPVDQAKLAAALESEYGHRVISRWLKDKGVHLTEHVVARHRLRECKCWTE